MLSKFLDFFKTKIGIALCAFATLIFLGSAYFFTTHSDGKLHLYFLDVGQGDAALIKTPDGKFILIDGGPGKIVLRRLGETLPYFHRTIDLIIATHTDKDHSEGLIAVLDRYNVKHFLMPGSFQNNPLVTALLKKLSEKNVSVLLAHADYDFVFDHDTKLDILYPFQPMIGETDATNNTSIIFKLIHPRITALYTGDADETVEQKFIKKGIDVKADILKVGHHGSKTSTSEIFLEKVRPKKAVISVGKNRYGHPTQQVLDRLKKFDIEILRTDQHGNIIFLTENPKNYLQEEEPAEKALLETVTTIREAL